jgi:hypothetical protein
VIADPDTLTAAQTDGPTPDTSPPPAHPDDPHDPDAPESVEPAAGPPVTPLEPGEPATPGDSNQPAGHTDVPAALRPAPALSSVARTECGSGVPGPVVGPVHPAAATEPLVVPLAQCQPGIALPVINGSNLKVGAPVTPCPAPSCPAPPAFVIGGGVLPAPLLGGVLERARIRRVRHPGIDAPPEPRYTPSRELADFVRCRDLTCRWPGCDKPSYHCDLDHTVPYPLGPRMRQT